MLWLGAEGGGFEAPPRILFQSIPIFRRGVGGDTFRSSPIATRPARRRPGSHNRRPPKPNQQKRTQKTSKSTKKTICRSELPSKPHPIEKEKGRRGAGRTVRKTSRNVRRPRVLRFCKPAGPPGSGPSKRTIVSRCPVLPDSGPKLRKTLGAAALHVKCLPISGPPASGPKPWKTC